MSLTLVTPPSIEPLNLDEAKAHLRVLDDADDPYVTALITAARQMVESGESWSVERSLLATTWRLTMNRFTPCITLPRPPLIEVNEISYVDAGGAVQTLSPEGYTVDARSEPARIVPAYGRAWPVTRGHVNDVVVTFTAGYGVAPDDVPQAIRQAILLGVGDLYELRQSTITGTIVNVLPAMRALLNGYQWCYR